MSAQIVKLKPSQRPIRFSKRDFEILVGTLIMQHERFKNASHNGASYVSDRYTDMTRAYENLWRYVSFGRIVDDQP